MTHEGMKRTGGTLSEKELAGFLRLLLAGDNLPEPSEELLAYLEHLGDSNEMDRDAAVEIARAARAAIIKERLRSSNPRPVRALGSHLLAKRIEASCRVEDVAAILGERVELLRALESHNVDPLTLGAARIAAIAEAFGLVISELRESLTLALSGATPRASGASFARSHEAKLKSEVMRLAEEDLLRASRPRPESRDSETHARIESTLAEVRSILEQRGLKTLLD